MMRRRTSRSGMSLFEVAVAASGTVILFGMVALGTQSAFGTWQGTVSGTEMERHASGAMDRIVGVVADAGLTTIAEDLSPSASASGFTFSVRKGFTSGAITWSPATTIEWISDPEDARDDIDNDGDGLIDEGQVMMTDANGMNAVLARNVTEYLAGETDATGDENANGLEDEQGLSFVLVGNRLHIRLTLARVGADGEMVTRSAESIVKLLD